MITCLDIQRDSSLPAAETEILLSFLLNKSRVFILTHPATAISPANYKKFRALETKRLKSWPLAYLTGQKEFYGLDFKVTPAVLTPRPETEMIVEKILNKIKEDESKLHRIIIDLGTGSGAIIIAVAQEIRRLFPNKFISTDFVAVDISPRALTVAKQNAKKHKLAGLIKFYRGDLLTPLALTKQKLLGRQLIIAANLPYLTPQQIKAAPSIQREPHLALAGGHDGLKYYRRLFQQLSRLDLNTTALLLICEIDPDQKSLIENLAKRYFPAAHTKVDQDLSGQLRFLTISKIVE